MTADLATADAIFLALADLDPADRARFLDVRCGADTALRLEVEAMVAALDLPDDAFLDPARIPTLDMAAVDGPLQPGTSLGDFHVLHALGSGGMGVVYAAQQDRPRRTVAIKVLRRGFRHREMLRRFEYEAEILGRLQHPGIAQVYAFCPGDRTTPAHLVMELVAGPPITDYARAQRLSTRERVALAITLCAAVQHAHERGVIHRDLKPANVLVADGGQPKVLDFGIARATAADVQRLTIQTAHGQLMGTLAYMSPEQLRGRSDDVDIRSDIYALGVLLYRLLAERLPFDIADLPWAEAVQCVLEAAPAPMAAADPSLTGSIAHIVARAMARDRDERYQTAAELTGDLQRFLDGREPIASALAAAVSDRSAAPLPEIAAGDLTIAATRDGRLVVAHAASGAIVLVDAESGRAIASVTWRDGRIEIAETPTGPRRGAAL